MSTVPLTTVLNPPAGCPYALDEAQIEFTSSYWENYSTYAPENAPFYPQVYSPGICPQGYTPACTNFLATDINAEETTFACCPR